MRRIAPTSFWRPPRSWREARGCSSVRTSSRTGYFTTLPRELPLNEFHGVVLSSLPPNNGVLFGFEYMQELDALGRWPYLAFLGEAGKLDRPRLFHLLGALNVQYVTALHELPEEGIA